MVYDIIDDSIKQGLKTDIEKQLNQLEKILVLNQQKIKYYDQEFLRSIRRGLSVKMIELNDVIINQLDHINQARFTTSYFRKLVSIQQTFKTYKIERKPC